MIQIEYLWIDKWRNIEFQGFNFSADYVYNYDSFHNKLSRKAIDFKTDNFFKVALDQNNIKNFTAIVGQNGTGKTNIIRRLAEVIVEYPNSPEQPYFLIYRIDNEYYYQSRRIEITNLDKLNIQKITSPGDFGISNHELIYFTPIFDPTTDFDPLDNIDKKIFHNISTSRLIHEGSNMEANKNSDTFASKSPSHKHAEISRTIDIVFNSDLKVPFPLPDKLVIRPLEIIPKDNDILNGTFKKFAEINFSYRPEHYPYKESDVIERLKVQFWKCITLSFLIDITGELDLFAKISFRKIIAFVEEYFFNKDPDRIDSASFAEFYNKLKTVQRLMKINLQIDSILSIMKFIDGYYKAGYGQNLADNYSNQTKHLTYSGPDRPVLIIDSSNYNKKEFKEFIHNYYRSFIHTNYFEFSFRSNENEGFTFSDGEKNYLRLFSRLYDLLLYRTSHNQLLLLLDEPDLTFHPEWQRTFIHSLIAFLGNFPELNFQIVITSHSPFLISDLPKSNLIFMERDCEIGKVVDALDKDENTFGANIHRLLSKPFFMHNGLMGEFAKSKIEGIVELLQKEEIGENELNAAQKVIDVIGEPMIKNRLNDMLQEKVRKEESVEERIARLWKELKDAEEDLKKGNDKN